MTTDLGLDLAAGKGPVPAGSSCFSAAFALDAERPAGVGAKDTFVSLGWARQATAAYARPGGVEHAILGRDLSGLPPVHVQYSERGDARRRLAQFVAELRAAGADARRPRRPRRVPRHRAAAGHDEAGPARRIEAAADFVLAGDGGPASLPRNRSDAV